MLTPAQVLRLRFALEDKLSSPGSLSGYQADRLAAGLSGPSGNGARSNGADRERAHLADLVLLCRDLTDAEIKIARLKYGTSTGTEVYRRHRRPCDMRDGDGEQVINAVTERDGFVEVEGKRYTLPTTQQLADLLDCKPRRVRVMLEAVRQKIANQIKVASATQPR